MGYIDDKLDDNEKIVCRVSLHWVMFIGPALLLFLSGISIPANGRPAIVLFIIGLAWAVLSYIALRNTEFAVTNKRLLIWTVFPWKKLYDIALVDIANADVYLPSLGKLLNFGKITIILNNRKRISRRLVSGPDELLKNLSQQIEIARGKEQKPTQNNT
jgi:hypothetical protein